MLMFTESSASNIKREKNHIETVIVDWSVISVDRH